jgi:putative ABC transport system permease protein
MRWFHVFRLRLRSLFRRATLDRELDDELRFHLELQIQQNLAAGMTLEQARAAARRAFGNPALHEDGCRDARGITLIENFREDFRHAIRGFSRDRFLACAAAVTLALAIGATTTVFSIADSILIRPLPYPNADRIDWISEASGPTHEEIAVAPDYYTLRDRNRIFEEVGNYWPLMLNWTGVEHPEQLHGAAVPDSFFRVMGTAPLIGRYVSPADEGPGKARVAVLSYDFWRNRLGSDPQIIGKTVALDRLPRSIVGVMPQGFDFPHGIQIWVPSDVDEAADREISLTRGIRILLIVARRRPEVTPLQAEAEMHRLSADIRAEYQMFKRTQFRTDLSITAVPLQQHLTRPLRPALLVLTGAVGLVLLIACVNIANLLLAQAAARQRALAVRLALGSGRGRIARQMLTESLALALPGALIGVALAWIAVRVLDAAKPAILVRYPPISMDGRVLAFTFALTLITSLVFGSAPAWFASGIHIQEVLKAAGLTHTTGHGAARLRKLLLVAELAVSLILLIGAGLLTRSFLHLAHTDLGFQTDHLLTFQVQPIGSFDRDNTRFFTQLLERMKSIPGAQTAALLGDIPLSDENLGSSGRIRVEGRPPVPAAELPVANITQVSPEFFRTLAIPLQSGRLFDSRDAASSPIRVVVNQTFVHRVFPGDDPLGRRMVFGLGLNPVTWTIIGVVADVRSGALGADPPSTVYRCTCNGGRLFRAAFAVRTIGDPKSAVRDVEAAVRSVDRDQPIFDVETMDERRDDAMASPRFQLLLIGTFAGLAVLLAVAGIYGVMSYLVSRRTREIGIRIAMGARPANVLRMVLGEGALLGACAIISGLAGAWALTRYLKSMLYGVTELDSVTFAVTPILLAFVLLAASLGPARRAARVDPVTALKDE